jgi:hypothetical protein
VRRTAAVQYDLPTPTDVWLDGVPAGRVRTISARVEPDALTVVV